MWPTPRVPGRDIDAHLLEWGQISFDITGIELDIPDDGDHEWMTFLVPSPSGLQVVPPRSWTCR